MAKIIDIFTRKELFLNECVVPVLDKPYAEIKNRLEARFGDKLPAHFKKCLTSSQVQPYMHGDVHNVSYRDKKNKKFNAPMPVPCEVIANSCAKENDVLVLGKNCIEGIDEPFPWMDTKYQVSLNFLKSLPDGTPLVIYTRSDLVATSDYVDQLVRLKVSVNIMYASKDDTWNRVNEPGAPSVKRRIAAVNALKNNGIVVKLIRNCVQIKVKASRAV